MRTLFSLVFIWAGLGFSLAADRPNILYIMSDDHAAHAIGAYGGRLAKLNPTPHIDRLAKEGMRLENVFCVNSICTPSRATIMTGQYSHQNGVRTLKDELPREKHTLAMAMQKAGYMTAMIGKWHLKVEPNGFDYYNVLPGQGTYHNPTLKEKGEVWTDGNKGGKPHTGHSSDVITDISLKWLETRDRSKPFFLMHHFKAPHGMFEHAERYEKLYAEVDIPEPESLWKRARHGPIGRPRYGTSISRRNPTRNMGMHMKVDAALSEEAYTRESYQRYLRKFLRCVMGVDDNIGRLLEALEKSKELDNTIIIYTADQGFMLGEHDYIDKRWMYEESLRMPFIVRYPKKIKAGSTADALIENVDFAPTLLSMAGADVSASMQGRSFLPILEGQGEPEDWRKSTYYRYWMHMAHHWNPAHYGVRTKDHKLIFYYGMRLDAPFWKIHPHNASTTPHWEMYDLKKDPQEMNNVYNNPEYAATVQQLKAELLRLKKANGDTDEKYPELMKIRASYWE